MWYNPYGYGYGGMGYVTTPTRQAAPVTQTRQAPSPQNNGGMAQSLSPTPGARTGGPSFSLDAFDPSVDTGAKLGSLAGSMIGGLAGPLGSAVGRGLGGYAGGYSPGKATAIGLAGLGGTALAGPFGGMVASGIASMFGDGTSAAPPSSPPAPGATGQPDDATGTNMGGQNPSSPGPGPGPTSPGLSVAGWDNDQGNNVSGGGSGGDGGKVICTELHRQGLLPDHIYKLDALEGVRMAEEHPDVVAGYHKWGKPIARLMAKSRLVTAIVFPFGAAWAYHMAGRKNPLGWAMVAIGVPICRVLGQKTVVKDFLTT